MLFNGKYKKALTFSFDDGNVDDVRLIEILNKYGLKGTFNLNGGKLTRCSMWVFNGQKEVRHLNFYESKNVYDGHEIACHGYTHPYLETLERESLYNEVALDRKILEFLYEREVCGMAYPFGTYSEQVIEVLKECEIEYSRTIKSTNSFGMPEKPFEWDPTCHFMAGNIDELADEFLNYDGDDIKLFYIWGHSYELVTEEDWQKFDEFCKKISGKDDVYYCSNIEALRNLK